MKATREHILREIKRLAAREGCKPPGWNSFRNETGISESAWRGVYWARWGDALTEAGYAPNPFQRATDENYVLEKLAKVVRHHQRVPTKSEIELYRKTIDKEIPAINNMLSRFGGMAGILDRLVEYVKAHPEYEDVAAILGDRVTASISKEPRTAVRGFVYLIKSGPNYKIGRTGNLESRMRGLALPDEKELVWKIETDDPVGIEAYWHSRFADRKVRSEWYKLTTEDVKAFKRWKKIS